MSRKRVLWVILVILFGGTCWYGYRAAHQSALNRDLLAASAKGDPLIVRALLDQGADPNARGEAGAESSWQHFLALLFRRRHDHAPIYPLTQALIFGPLDANHREVVRLLLEHHANPNVRTFSGESVLLNLCWNATNEDLLILVLQSGANPNTVDKTGSSPLMSALEEQKSAFVRALLDHGANPNLANADGDVPLMWAARCPDTDLVALLLAHGADIHHKNSSGQTALTYALLSGMEKPVDMLLNAGADVNIPDSQGCTPFLYAVQLNYPACAHMLAKGADVRKTIPLSPVEHGLTIRMRTQDSNDSMTIGIPFRPGATPLMLAAQSRNPLLVKAMPAKGADVNARDAKGKTALQYAENDPEIRALLQHAGARP